MLISELMIPELEREGQVTRKLLERVPPEKLGWKPDEHLRSVGWNASHLAEIAGWVPGIVNEDGLDIAAVDAGQTAATGTDVAAVLRRFDENLAQSLSALGGVADDRMDEPWTMRMGGQELFTMKKGDCIRKWVFAHTAHHRGILSVYLRMAGVKIGSIYEE